jgi:hypothetical protein
MLFKNDLQQLLDDINQMSGFSIENLSKYIALLKKGEELLRTIKNINQNPMLEIWIDMGLNEIQHELNGRLKNRLHSIPPEQQNTEFLYSRSAISLVFTNILMHL